MDSRFRDCLTFVLGLEGGFADDPADPGGATCCGVTIATLAEYLGRTVSVDDVRALTPCSASPIYLRLFWTPIQGDQLPKGVDLMTFDAAVNQGCGFATRMLQKAVNVPVDGVIGHVTLGAPALKYPKAVLQKLHTARHARYLSTPGFDRFGEGWLNRLAKVTAEAMKDAA